MKSNQVSYRHAHWHAAWPVMAFFTGFLLAVEMCHAQSITHNFNLHAGWNAVFLAVTPTNTAPAEVFAGLPLASAWTRAEPLSSARFIQNMDEPSFNEAEWLRFVPGQPEFVSTLKSAPGQRAYLLRLTNGPAMWRVTGKPAMRAARWDPDSYNLRNFPVDPSAPPTFKAFLQNSTAHFDPVQDRVRGVYRLSSGGQWVAVINSDSIEPQAAYWVYCKGASTFSAPLLFDAGGGESLDFGDELGRATLELNNLGPSPRIVTIRHVGNHSSGILGVRLFETKTGYRWADLPNPYIVTVSNGTPARVVLGIRRSQMAGVEHGSVLELTDNSGTRHVLPVTAKRTGDGYGGLWVGTVRVNAVSEPHFGVLLTNRYAVLDGQPTALSDPRLIVSTNLIIETNYVEFTNSQNEVVIETTLATNPVVVVETLSGEAVPVYEKAERNTAQQEPTPTRSDFNMRVILHVDPSGKARLLKEVVQMWRDGTYKPLPDGTLTVDKPGIPVLITQDALLSQFKGVTLREGTDVGRRMGSIGFDFDARGTNDMALSGLFNPGSVLTGEIVLRPDYPLNPFRHKYHPDHDNLNSQFEPIADESQAESYGVQRSLRFELSSASTATDQPDPAYSIMEGTYRETLVGLHKQPLLVKGSFRLVRVSYISALNPSPVP